MLQIEQLKNDLNIQAKDKYFLEWDGDEEDNRFHGTLVRFDTDCLLTESEYNQIIEMVEGTAKETEDYQIYFGYDSSGYDYWYRRQEEGNYIQLTVNIKNVENINVESLITEIYQIIEELSDKIESVKTIDEMFMFDYKIEMGL